MRKAIQIGHLPVDCCRKIGSGFLICYVRQAHKAVEHYNYYVHDEHKAVEHFNYYVHDEHRAVEIKIR